MDNLDTSSSGENISLYFYYDSDLTQIYYEDFIAGADGNAVYKIESSREVLAYLIGDSDKPFYTKTALNKMKKADLLELWQDLDFGYNDEYTKSEYISDLLSVTIARYYDYLQANYNFNEIKDHFAHNYFISRGYCQGDAVYIIDVGADYDIEKNRQSIDHILWDTPISINLTIDDNYELGYELLDDEYEYNKDNVIENLNKLDISDYAKTWLAENMPSEPNYS